MALKPCRECGAQVSDAANTCPSCGVQSPAHKLVPARKTVGCLGALGIAAVILIVLGVIGTLITPDRPAAPAKSKQALSINVAVVVLKALKNSMKDPDSFELKSLIVHPSGTACYEYRATNSFNAHIAGAAVLTPKGKFLTREQNGNAFVAAWNNGCTPADGEDMTEVAKELEQILR
jgi:hypothetical protein